MNPIEIVNEERIGSPRSGFGGRQAVTSLPGRGRVGPAVRGFGGRDDRDGGALLAGAAALGGRPVPAGRGPPARPGSDRASPHRKGASPPPTPAPRQAPHHWRHPVAAASPVRPRVLSAPQTFRLNAPPRPPAGRTGRAADGTEPTRGGWLVHSWALGGRAVSPRTGLRRSPRAESGQSPPNRSGAVAPTRVRGGGRWRRGRACTSCLSRRGRAGCGRPSCRRCVGAGWRRRAPRLR